MQPSLMFKKYLKAIKNYVLAFLRWLIFAVLLGSVCGVVGAGFAHSISAVTALRVDNPWIIYMLPVGGLLIVLCYHLFKVRGIGTDHVLESVASEKSVSPLLAPAIFLGSVITHLLGGSAGREGAALQLGGSLSSLFCRLLRLNEETKDILTICGMGAVFSALFGTPIGACVFALEIVCVGKIRSTAIFPALISSITAGKIALLLHVEAEHFPVAAIPSFDFSSIWRVAVIAICGSFISLFFCKLLKITEHFACRTFPNPYLRILVGGSLIVLLTLLVGTFDYNGGGIEVIQRIFTEHSVNYEAFILKLIFTVITVAAGFKGGEIVPTLFIGATFGGAASLLIGLDPSFGAAIGMVALFCGVTNCPLATIFLSVELFGSKGLVFFALSIGISFLLSGKSSLYKSQVLLFSKYDETSN